MLRVKVGEKKGRTVPGRSSCHWASSRPNQECLTLQACLDTGEGHGESTGVKDVSFVQNEAADFTHFSAKASTFTALRSSHHNSLHLREKQETPVTVHVVFSAPSVSSVSLPQRLSDCLSVRLPNAIICFPKESPGLVVKTRWGWIEFLMPFLSHSVLPRVYTDRLL